MTIDASDVTALLPPDRVVGEVRILDVAVADGFDSEGAEAAVVTVTLALPAGPTWNRDDVHRMRTAIRRGLEAAGERRQILLVVRPESDPDAPVEDGQGEKKRG